MEMTGYKKSFALLTTIFVFTGIACMVLARSPSLSLIAVSEIENGDLEIKSSGSPELETLAGEEEGSKDLLVTIDRGKSVYIKKALDMRVNGKDLSFTLNVSAINESESDYKLNEARYPFFLQLIFDSSPRNASIKERMMLEVNSFRDEKIKTRENIIYAFGNRMPKDSIINPHPGCAVISIGDEKDRGNLLQVVRKIEDDYRFSFGEKLASGLEEVVIGFEGGDEGGKKISVRLSDVRLVGEKKE